MHERHEAWINRQKDCEILTIDTEYYDIEKTEDQLEVKNMIASFVDKVTAK